MADEFTIRINDAELKAKLNTFGQAISPRPLLKIAGAVMLGSIDRTFREQGSPAGSWPPLKAWTAAGARNRIGFRVGKVTRGRTSTRSPLTPGRMILILSGRLKNSVTTEAGVTIEGNTMSIGSNLVYARIQQMGGRAGRNHASQIPPRPYLVFRPEDPARLVEGMQAFIDQQAAAAGLK